MRDKCTRRKPEPICVHSGLLEGYITRLSPVLKAMIWLISLMLRPDSCCHWQKRFVGGLHRAFGVLAAFDNTGVAQVGFHITGQNKGIGAHLAQRVRPRVTT